MALEFFTDAHVGIGASHNQAARNRNHQCRYNSDQTIADGEDGISLQRTLQFHSVLQNADEKASNDVDGGDQNTGNGIALRETRGTVHGTVELGFGG